MKVLTAFFQTIVVLSVSMAATLQPPSAPQRSKPIGIGDMAPDFTLQDQNKKQVALADARHKNRMVLVFYRGYW